MTRTWTALSLGLFCVTALACGTSTPTSPSSRNSTPTSPSSATLRGEVTDPAGDSPSDPRIPVSSDLVRATVEVSGGQMTFVVQFAPGTLDPQLTRVVVLLDTDQNTATGIRQADGMGVDYSLEFVAGQATISRANPVACAARQNCYDVFGSVPATAVQDGMQAMVPLTMLGNTDGHMTFKLHSYVTLMIDQMLASIMFDVMPDQLLPLDVFNESANTRDRHARPSPGRRLGDQLL